LPVRGIVRGGHRPSGKLEKNGALSVEDIELFDSDDGAVGLSKNDVFTDGRPCWVHPAVGGGQHIVTSLGDIRYE
jgi:hypothetical protein